MVKNLDICEAFLRGDVSGFNSIYLAYNDDLIRHGKRTIKNLHDIEDAVAEAFERLYKKIGTFESSQHINDYLYKTVKFECLKKAKKSRRAGNLSENESADIADTSPQPLDVSESNLHRNYWIQEVKSKLEQLPSRRGEVFRSYFFENIPIAEIAIRMSINPDTVRHHLRKAKKEVQIDLKNKGFGNIPLTLLMLFLLSS